MSSIPSPDLSDRTPVHRHHVDGFGEVRLVPVDPDADLDLLYAWVTEERAKFWGMNGHTREEVHETYTFLDGLTTHHAFLAVLGGRPAALFQTYEPEADPLGECYDVQPGDHGVHLLIGPAHGGQPVANFSSGLIIALIDYVLTDPGRRRIVVEPDARNERAIERLRRVGFVLGPEIDKPEKRARLAFLERAEAEAAVKAVSHR
ncbi:acetyltransferase [Streptomyces sp. CHA1]|nr:MULTISPECIES: GNAT family N-acetyltransferase [unclassified Streptomyces]RWZ73579.1 N-acetyltransferase [Streptomyces albidoflavus]MBT3160187.1 acetyltransferase [Streptomyces sp. G11C]MCO6699304.1 acetyltransferase [Streptomyces sp. CHB9.2]MCO6707392.1 acetyltransferase [Streptomyces sp. CHA3]MCO6713129.1 acetyltransferase [Streptomyces sp. CHB19.2]